MKDTNILTKLAGLTLAGTLSGLLAGCGQQGASGEQPQIEQITGIDSGAGIMEKTKEAIEVYNLDLELIPSSGPAMTAALGEAYDDQEPIIVTGWQPHWKFAIYDLKFLEDPEGIYGAEETCNTIARVGFEDDHPAVAQFLRNFELTGEQLASLMNTMRESEDEYSAARQWKEDNPSVVEAWMPASMPSGGGTLEVAYPNWAEGVAMTHLVAVVLEDEFGMSANLKAADPGLIYASIAEGDQDFMVDAWLPVTHASYMEQYGDQLVDLGPNFVGAKIGLVVPSYMDIDSIADLPIGG